MYIYKFTHIDSGRSYIGQTIQDPNQRRLEHINGSKYSTRTYHFHNAIKKYGIDSFIFEVIDSSASSLEELNILEEKYVIEYDSINNGFNIRNPGSNKTHNPESIERMCVAQKNAHARRREQGIDGGWKRKDGGPMLGKVHPNKGGASANKGKMKGKTWEEIYGPEVAKARRKSMAKTALRKKLNTEASV
jgi:group I intron endonuclease